MVSGIALASGKAARLNAICPYYTMFPPGPARRRKPSWAHASFPRKGGIRSRFAGVA